MALIVARGAGKLEKGVLRPSNQKLWEKVVQPPSKPPFFGKKSGKAPKTKRMKRGRKDWKAEAQRWEDRAHEWEDRAKVWESTMHMALTTHWEDREKLTQRIALLEALGKETQALRHKIGDLEDEVGYLERQLTGDPLSSENEEENDDSEPVAPQRSRPRYIESDSDAEGLQRRGGHPPSATPAPEVGLTSMQQAQQAQKRRRMDPKKGGGTPF